MTEVLYYFYCRKSTGQEFFVPIRTKIVVKLLLVLFCDNAYLNTSYTATPFPNDSSGCKDDYNFCQCQLRIGVKCTFGQLVCRCGILRSAILSNVTILKAVALVSCLARLHNFSVDEGDRLCEVSLDEETLPIDLENMMNNPDGYVPLMAEDNHDVEIPLAIMDAGHHFDDGPEEVDAQMLL